MARIKRGTRKKRRHKKVLKLAKGYWGARSKLFRPANEAVMRALNYAYRDRRRRKREFRRLWISRINAAARQNDLPYSRFMHGLREAGIEINRKMLAEMAVHHEEAFSQLVEEVKEELA